MALMLVLVVVDMRLGAGSKGSGEKRFFFGGGGVLGGGLRSETQGQCARGKMVSGK